MDCNREEAIRAKTIAETKMQSKDFVGAQKFALKAQKLHPEVENISQILIICEVHCSAAKRLYSGDLDWYGILQIEKTADEASIKKQYRRFALQLHPDKNKFAGAEGAFKLIGEAQRTLLDKDKRRIHDAKHGGGGSRVHMAPAYRGGFHYPAQTRPVANPVPTDPGSAFWTACPFCLNKFQYLRDVMHRSLRCQTCSKPFIALDIYSGPSPAANFTKPVFPTAPPANGSFKVEVRAQQGFGATGPSYRSRTDPVRTAGVNHSTTSDPAKPNRARREKKRVRKRSKDSDSEPSANESVTDSEDSVDSNNDGDTIAKQSLRDQSVRRSSRSKQKISYKENLSDNDDDNNDSDSDNDNNDDYEENGRVSKKSKGKLSEEEEEEKESKSPVNDVPKEEESNSPVKDTPKESFDDDVADPDPDQDSDADQDPDTDSLFSYPDPDFSDFEKGRAKERFAAGQVWAAYDNQGAMPRFYVKIKRVDHSTPSGFRAVITWLEPDPGTEAETQWVSAKLPFSCGLFCLGNTEDIENLPMFSHLMPWSKGPKRNSFCIYPRKGETWGLFKNWDLKWSSDPDKVLGREFDYEFVEILSDFDPGVGIHVALLSKVEGFVSLFAQTETLGKRTILVPSGWLSRFSHMVSSEKMRGDEGEGVPAGSFELDPASLPMTLLAGSKPKPETGRENRSTRPSPENFEIPEPEFHNFDSSKTEGGFRVGDVWAMYCDEDGLPKYYCRVEQVVTGSAAGFELKVSWLACEPESGNSISWNDPKIPVCCGRFRPKKNGIQSYDSTRSFSHRVGANPVGNKNNKKNEYLVLPKKGEIWALYSDWRADMSLSDLGTCEYEIVEIVSSNDYQISAIVLDRVHEFNSVFKAKIINGSSKLIVKKYVSRAEIVRFSHQIPAFRLTDQRGGQLRGFWELDPAALPVHFFSLKFKESKN